MKAEAILRHLSGQLAGALARVEESRTRLASLQHVAEDVSSGVVRCAGLDRRPAGVLAAQLFDEVAALETVDAQLRAAMREAVAA